MARGYKVGPERCFYNFEVCGLWLNLFNFSQLNCFLIESMLRVISSVNY